MLITQHEDIHVPWCINQQVHTRVHGFEWEDVKAHSVPENKILFKKLKSEIVNKQQKTVEHV